MNFESQCKLMILIYNHLFAELYVMIWSDKQLIVVLYMVIWIYNIYS